MLYLFNQLKCIVSLRGYFHNIWQYYVAVMIQPDWCEEDGKDDEEGKRINHLLYL